MSPLAAMPPKPLPELLIHQARPAIYARDSSFWSTNRGAVQIISSGSSFWNRELHIQHIEQLVLVAQSATSFEAGWDGYDAPKPAKISIDLGVAVLNKIKEAEVNPYSVLPSADGGIGISFRGQDGRRALLEIANDGSASYIIYGKGHPRLAGDFDPSDTDLDDLFRRLQENL